MFFNFAEPSFEDIFSKENLEKIFNERIAESNFRGVDGTTVKSFEADLGSEARFVSKNVLNGEYSFSRYKEKLILKSALSLPRQISIPTVRDALVLRALCDHLAMRFPESVPRPPHEFIKKIVQVASSGGKNLSFVRLDIKSFYPSVSHEILLDKLVEGGMASPEVELVKSAIQTVTGKPKVGHTNSIGVPQGLSISNILASLYFADFDKKWSKKESYFRYVDDILIMTESKNAKATLDEVHADLKDSLQLDAHEQTTGGSGKTTIRTLNQGVDYLGYTISDGPLQVRERSYRKIFDAIVKICTRHKYDGNDPRFLWKLNLRITGCTFHERSIGWAFYFRQMDDMAQLHRLDVFVRQMLKKYGRPELADRVMSFVKAHREIRYNRADTKYIPNFDTYTLGDMVQTVALLTKETEEDVGLKTRAEIEKQFFGLVKKQAVQLEQETIDLATS